MKILMNKYIVIFNIVSSLCFTLYSHTLEEALTILTTDQALEQIKIQAYNSLTPHEQLSLMPDNYFTQLTESRAILIKLVNIIITRAQQQNLFTLSNEHEYDLLRTTYTQQIVAAREAQLSLKLRNVKNILAEKKKFLLDTDRENCAERIYTEVILPKTEDKILCADQEFYTTYKKAYKIALAEKLKER